MNKKKIAIISIIALIVIICLGILLFTGNNEEPKPNAGDHTNNSTGELTGKAPSKIDDDEKDVRKETVGKLAHPSE